MTVKQQKQHGVQLRDAGEGVFWIEVQDTRRANALNLELIAELCEALAAAREAQALKVLVIKGLPGCFLQGGRQSIDAVIEYQLHRAIAEFEHPVIAAMQSDATGAGFLLAALCDVMVCSREARYGFTSVVAQVFPTAEEEQLFSERFGEAQAARLLYEAGALTGQAMQAQGWRCPIVPAAEVEACAQKLAASFAGKSERSLRLLKRHLAQRLVGLSQGLKKTSLIEEPSTAGVTITEGVDGVLLADSLGEPKVQVRSQPGQVLRVTLDAACGPSVAAALVKVLAKINDAVKTRAIGARSIVLDSGHAEFVPVSDSGAARQLQQALLDSALPVAAVLGADAKDAAWLIAQCCDSVVHLRDGRYGAAGLLHDAVLASAACVLFSRRFGPQLGKEMLLAGATYSGGELQQRAGVAVADDTAEGLARALALAQDWAAWPAGALQAWRLRRERSLREDIEMGDWPACKPSDPPVDADADAAEPDRGVPLVLDSAVISASVHPNGIVRVRMEDREAKNLFSDALIRGMREVLTRIEQCSAHKVVILTGFDNYFASGGTREALLAIQQGKLRFTDDSTYLWAFSCALPVIAALQGHAVGGGLSLGLFADFVLLSEESRYVSPYMNYGFTPGAGATLIVPQRFGHDLARQTLLTGLEYGGSELQARGLGLPVVSRAGIEQAAFELARRLARHSRGSLMALKRRFNRDIERQLANNTQQELRMHEQTFVGQAQTLHQITSSFASATGDTAGASAPIDVRAPSAPAADTLAQIGATLKSLLASELHMSEADIDEDVQFVDLGLDSITGVTWVRKINERFNTSIAAIKVYSHPNLRQMSRFVQEQAAKAGAAPAGARPAQASPVPSDAAAAAVPAAPRQEAASGAETAPMVTPSRELHAEIAATLKALLAQELHMQLDDVDENTPFIDLGLDSITGVTWTRKINERYGTAIAAIKVYSHPTLTQLSAHVLQEIGKRGAPVAAPQPKHAVPMAVPEPARSEPPRPRHPLPADSREASGRVALKPRQKLSSWRGKTASRPADAAGASTRPQPIAVIGMAGRFPMATTLQQYWNNIAGARNCISEIPKDRWDIDAYYHDGDAAPGKTNSKWMGLLEDHDRFDPLFFDISPKEALSMDPQQRLFLQTCWHAIENAGYAPKSLSATKCGVFAGCGPSDYHLLSRDLQTSALGFTGADTAILAARVSYFLNLQGPCLSIETACSSSLVAMATACDNIAAGNCDLALAGGVYVTCGPDLHVKTAQTGMLSRAGQCFTFDQRADGFVPGEGVGVVLLKRLALAEADGDHILGVIEGWGVNQDGKTNGITAPNPDSQTRLQRDVYDRFGIDPGQIQLVEAHGTGTKLGDPIEVDALKQSFAAYTQRTGYCALGSVKSNIGHCFTAAGAASVIKVLLALEHEQLPPTINFERLNEHIALDGSPFFVNDRLQAWGVDGADRRRAAVSGFGFGGTNAHVVIAQYRAVTGARPNEAGTAPGGKAIVPLSARTPQQLRQKAADLIEFLRIEGARADIASIAYTLQVGREAMEERAAFLAGSADELVKALRAFVGDERDTENGWQGQVSSNKEAMSLLRQDADVRDSLVRKWIAQRQLAQLAKLWVKGLEIDWHQLHGTAKPRRMPLPMYPFARDRYWIEDIERARTEPATPAVARLHPLLHRNTSTFSEQRYSSSFDGREAIFADLQGEAPKVLPASVCLDMARAAVSDALGGQAVAPAAEVSGVEWGEPFVMAEGREVTTAVFATGDDLVEFEIFSGTRGSETIHCRGCISLVDACVADSPADALVPAAATPSVEVPSAPHLVDSVGEIAAQRPDLPSLVELQQALKNSLAEVLYLSAADIRLDRPFIELGLDSIVGVEWVGDINKRYGLGLTATKLYDYPNILELAAFIEQALRSRRAPEAVQVATPVASAAPVLAKAEPPAVQQPASPVLSVRELQQKLTASLAEALYMEPAAIRPDKPFVELGLDSIVGVEWVAQINKDYGIKVNATRVYDYTNIAEFSAFLDAEIRKAGATPPAPAATPASPVDAVPPVGGPAPQVRAPAKAVLPAMAPAVLSRRSQPVHSTRRTAAFSDAAATGKVAIIGMSGRYPDAPNLRKFWDNLVQGRNSIREVPPSRWDVNRFYDPDPAKEGKVYCKWLGMLDDIDCFDPLFFKISPAEAKTMDPQHRLFLEESYHAFEDAGYSGRMLGNRKCGVYLGLIGNEYARIVARNSAAAVDLTGNNYAIGAARVAYFLNLKGPAITIDTACSSSLVAIHLACQSLLGRETDMALAGGVTVYLEPEAYMGMCQAGMLSPDGQCKTFDNAANGFVPGEGVGAVVLKRLEDAQRDGDFIYGVIAGSGINQDGKTNGITAPSVNSQIALERELYERCGIHPDTVSYVEMHGTGTKLGDPIELEALSTVFREKTQRRNYCALGSVKSNVGHTSGAAGVAAVQKALLCMQHRMLVPTLNVKTENTLFDFANSPFYVSRETRAWDAAPGSPRRAGVSSFGFSGTNAHLILEEYVPPVEATPALATAGGRPDALIVLSARTADQLRQKAQDLLDFVRSESHAKPLDLMDLACTLMTGREMLDERLGLVAGSLDELADRLQAHLRAEREVRQLHRGKVERDGDGVALVGRREGVADTLKHSIASRDLAKIAELWVAGLDLTWSELYADVPQRRVSLPTYPFARNRYWVEEKPGLAVAAVEGPVAKLHPLLHSNISVLGEHSYSATFAGNEFFLVALPLPAENRPASRALPAAAFLEMARAAVEQAVPGRRESRMPTLQHVVWGRPLWAAPNRQVNVALFWRNAEQVDFEIYSLDRVDSNADEIVHCQGQAVLAHRVPAAALDLKRLAAGMRRGVLTRDAVHERLGHMGWDYPRDLQGIDAIHRGDAQVLARLQVPAALAGTLGDYVLHPGLLDNALQSVIALHADGAPRASAWALPCAMASLRIESPCTSVMAAWVRESEGGHAASDRLKLDIDLTDAEGHLCARMQGVEYAWMPSTDRPVDRRPEPPAVEASPSATVSHEARGIALRDTVSPVPAPKAAGKPTRITLG